MSGQKRVDPYFAVFNCHINDAAKRADAEIIKQYGQESFDRQIKPLHDDGIMAVFGANPTSVTAGWVALVTYFVNEGRGA